jgi:hypothetical protein
MLGAIAGDIIGLSYSWHTTSDTVFGRRVSRCPIDKCCIIGQGKRIKHDWEYFPKSHRCLYVKQDVFCSLPEAKLGVKVGP